MPVAAVIFCRLLAFFVLFVWPQLGNSRDRFRPLELEPASVSAFSARPSPTHLPFVLPRLRDELHEQAQVAFVKAVRANSFLAVEGPELDGPGSPTLTPPSRWKLDSIVNLNLSGVGPRTQSDRRVLIVANRADDHSAFARRVQRVRQLLAGRGVTAAFLFPVGAALRLSAQDRQSFHKEVSELFDGMILLGGADIDPSLYKASPQGARDTNLLRDQLEMELVRAFLQYGDGPVLGICRGSQMLAVAHGCRLIQDVPSTVHGAIKHGAGDDGNPALHRIDFVPTTNNHLAKALGIQLGPVVTDREATPTFVVNSTHHQGALIEQRGGLEVVAYAPDGVVEIFESQDGRVIGVQSHPENQDPSGFGSRIFDHFVGELKVRAHAKFCKGLLY